jgi:uncharacterized protein (DUF952 family)
MIFHIARASDWETARDAGEYRISTLGRTLDEEGFIHCSATPDQCARVLGAFYDGVTAPLVLLTIDPARVSAPIRHEASGDELFPHVYGPLPVDAVVQVTPIANGTIETS